MYRAGATAYALQPQTHHIQPCNLQPMAAIQPQEQLLRRTADVNGRDDSTHCVEAPPLALVRGDSVIFCQQHRLRAGVDDRPRVTHVGDRQVPAALHCSRGTVTPIKRADGGAYNEHWSRSSFSSAVDRF